MHYIHVHSNILLHNILAIHYWAHTFNVEFFIEAYNKTGVSVEKNELLRALSFVGREDDTWVNPVDEEDTVCLFSSSNI